MKFTLLSFPGDSVVKNPQHRRYGFNPWLGKIHWRRKWQPTSVFLPGKSHRQRILTSYSPWVRKESDATEWLKLSIFTLLRCTILWVLKNIYIVMSSLPQSIENILSSPTVPLCSFLVSFFPPPTAPGNHWSDSMVLPSPECYVNGIIKNIVIHV